MRYTHVESSPIKAGTTIAGNIFSASDGKSSWAKLLTRDIGDMHDQIAGDPASKQEARGNDVVGSRCGVSCDDETGPNEDLAEEAASDVDQI